jgi:HEAT repeat protein
MKTVDELIRQLKSDYPHERMLAAHALGDHHDPRAVDALIQTLEDQSEDCATRIQAAHALGRMGDPKAIEPLIRTMEEEWGDCAKGLRYAIAEVLGEFRDPRATDTLVKLLGWDYFTASKAAYSLKKLRDRRAVEPLIRRIENKRFGGYQRQFAAEILGVLGDPRAIPALAKALHDNDEGIRKAASKSLSAFVPTHPDAILRLPPEDRHILGRLVQETERKKLALELCE